LLNEKEMNDIFHRLKNHQEMMETIRDLLDITEGVKGIERADDAELALIPEVRGLGKKCLKDWAEYQSGEKSQEARQKGLEQHSKKK
jgi:hypothetical protein